MANSLKRIGMDANRSLSKYLEEIGKYEPLKPSEEVELAKIVKGDECGILFESDNKIEKGDILSAYIEERTKSEL